MFSTFYGEKEILFAPFSRFLVLGKRKEYISYFKKCNVIYLREIELGLNNSKTILWVDD